MQKTRDFIIAYVKMYMYEVNFMSKVVEKQANAFKDAERMIKQFKKVQDDLQMILDYNFNESEIDAVNPAGLDTERDI